MLDKAWFQCDKCFEEPDQFQWDNGDAHCPCGGLFVEKPYEFPNNAPAKSSTEILTNTPGNIACQTCGCRDEQRSGCECICHKEA